MTYKTTVTNEITVEHNFQVGDTIEGNWYDGDFWVIRTIKEVVLVDGRPTYVFTTGTHNNIKQTEKRFRLKPHDYKFPVGARLIHKNATRPTITVLEHTTKNGRPAYRVEHHDKVRTYDAVDDLEHSDRWSVHHEPTKLLADYTTRELVAELQRRFG